MKKKNGPVCTEDPAKTLRSKRKERFCELYAFEYWEDPARAAALAGYKLTPFRLRMLLGDKEILNRVRFLRKTLCDQTVADETWIKDKFVEIAKNADKITDKLRALSSLYRAVVESEHLEKNAQSVNPDKDDFSSLSFDGEEDI